MVASATSSISESEERGLSGAHVAKSTPSVSGTDTRRGNRVRRYRASQRPLVGDVGCVSVDDVVDEAGSSANRFAGDSSSAGPSVADSSDDAAWMTEPFVAGVVASGSLAGGVFVESQLDSDRGAFSSGVVDVGVAF